MQGLMISHYSLLIQWFKEDEAYLSNRGKLTVAKLQVQAKRKV
jgi:hypothetical protein